MEQYSPGPELKKLNALVGNWNTAGTVRATSSSPVIIIKGTDSYEWVSGGFFLLHRVNVLIGEEKVEVIEVIGYDSSGKTYPMRSFDNQGNFFTMQSSVDEDGVWKITGEMMRSTLIISKNGNQMKAFWERSDDGLNWMPWMDMQFTKSAKPG